MDSTDINSEIFEFTDNFDHIPKSVYPDGDFKNAAIGLMRLDFRLKFTIGGKERKPLGKIGLLQKVFGKDEEIVDKLFLLRREYTNECIMNLSNEELGKLVKDCYFELFKNIEKWKAINKLTKK